MPRFAHAGLVLATAGAFGACRAKTKSAEATGATPSASGSGTLVAPPASVMPFYANHFSRRPNVAAMTELGRLVFADPALSASGELACASCHDPRFGYGPPNERATELGGPDLKSMGVRAVPSLRYLQTLPPFSEHHFDEAVDESRDQGPTGGHGWDGRVDTTHDQAKIPFTSPFEMANRDMNAVVTNVAKSAYATRFRATFGDDVFAEPERAQASVLMALEVFQQSPRDFYPYTSRYDAWLRQKVELSPAEERGRRLFDAPNRGNCAHCHPSGIRQGAFPQFTDFGFAALGVPRNRAVAANADANYFDLGLCGPARTDLAKHPEYCGQFRVPSLRNVAVRRAFFHNGVFHRLEDVLTFYAERDSDPAKFYPTVDGRLDAFDDLPGAYKTNVDQEKPFGRERGRRPALTHAEIADIIAFLQTLTDADLVTASAPEAVR